MKQERRLGQKRYEHEDDTAFSPVLGHGFEQNGIQRFAGLRHDTIEQVGDHQAHDREGQGGRHVPHGAFAGLHLRLAEDGQTVADRLDPGVRAGAHAIGAQDEQEHAADPQLRLRLYDVRPGRGYDRTHVSQIHDHGVADDERVGDHEGEEDGHQGEDRFLHSAHVHNGKKQYAEKREHELVGEQSGGKKTEQGIGPARHGNGDRQHIVDQERRARDHPCSR